MKITQITCWHLNLPLAKPYYLSGNRLKFEKLDSTFIRIDTDAGISGWGESCPWGETYLPAFGLGVRAGLDILAPRLLGHDPCALWHINHLMDEALPAHPYIKSALDVACWDILGKKSELPLYKLLGGQQAEPVPINSSISNGTPDEMIDLILKASAQGYRTHSAKVGGHDAASDIARIRAIVEKLPAGEKVTFDVNRAWTPAIAIEVMNATKDIAHGWFEQPCETLQQSAHVRQHTSQLIMLDEVLHDFPTHLEAWRIGACEGVKVKPNRLGGLTKSLQVRDFCVSVGWPMHIEDVGGTVLADSVAIHLASATDERYRLASWLCHAHLTRDPLSGQGARNQNGFATPPSLAGIGIEPDVKQLGDVFKNYQET